MSAKFPQGWGRRVSRAGPRTNSPVNRRQNVLAFCRLSMYRNGKGGCYHLRYISYTLQSHQCQPSELVWCRNLQLPVFLFLVCLNKLASPFSCFFSLGLAKLEVTGLLPLFFTTVAIPISKFIAKGKESTGTNPRCSF